MAELILTQAETDALSWLDLDDAALGKVIRNGMLEIAEVATENGRLLAHSAALLLVGIAAGVNADDLDLRLGGVTHADRAVGDWTIAVRHVPPDPAP